MLTKDPKTGTVLLSGGNPQIAKADGDAPVQAYIAAMPEWKRAILCVILLTILVWLSKLKTTFWITLELQIVKSKLMNKSIKNRKKMPAWLI